MRVEVWTEKGRKRGQGGERLRKGGRENVESERAMSAFTIQPMLWRESAGACWGVGGKWESFISSFPHPAAESKRGHPI